MIASSQIRQTQALHLLPRFGVGTLRHASLLLLALGVGTSSFTFNWVISHDVSANFFPEFAGSVLYLSDIFVVSGLIAWAAYRKQVGRLSKFAAGPLLISVPLVTLTVVAVISVSWADNGSMALVTAARRTYLLALYIVLVNERRGAGAYLAAVIIMGALLHGLIAIAQVFNESAVGAASLGELTRGAFGYDRVGSPDGYGIGFNPNPVGVHIAIGTLIAFALLVSRKGRQVVRLVLPALLVVALLGAVYTGAKSAFIAMGLGLVIVTLAGWWSQSISARRSLSLIADAMLLVIVLGGVAFILTPSVERRFTLFSPAEYLNSQSVSYGSRFDDYSLATPIIKENLLAGVGAGNYPHELTSRVAPNAFSPKVVPVHNVSILIQAELGLIGSAAWTVLFLSPLLLLLFKRDRKRRVGRSLVWLGPLVIVMTETLVDFTPWATQDGRLLFIAVIAMWAGHYDRGKTVRFSWRASGAWFRQTTSRFRSVSGKAEPKRMAADA